MVPVGSSVMLELFLSVHSYHVIAYLGYCPFKFKTVNIILPVTSSRRTYNHIRFKIRTFHFAMNLAFLTLLLCVLHTNGDEGNYTFIRTGS